MIIKAAQRGGAQQLACHLLNSKDNDHVELHHLRGFVSQSLRGALAECEALSRVTNCKQHMFSVSLNPPANAPVFTSLFENACERIEDELGLRGQPRAMVFHEKNARRHLHIVWGRIDTDGMKAINLPFFKNKLVRISKEIYLEQNWKLPRGFVDRGNSSPLTYTLAQWQQAKRLDLNPNTIKLALLECWSLGGNRESFELLLKRKGYYLARGDRRGFVALDWRGEVYSLARWLGLKKKDLRKKLGVESELSGVGEKRAKLSAAWQTKIQRLVDELAAKHDLEYKGREAEKKKLLERHRLERFALIEKQQRQYQALVENQGARFRRGLLGIFDRVTGKHRITRRLNLLELATLERAQLEKRDELVHAQLNHLTKIQVKLNELREAHREARNVLEEKIFSNMSNGLEEQLLPERHDAVTDEPCASVR